jgi:murein DD-endopeptidase MepM/ murein hydrolase activator NlpD
VPETTRIVFPLPAGTWTETSPFGPRTDPITGAASFHTGVDLAAPAGTPILAATDGRVIVAGMVDGTGTIKILATVDGQPLSTSYLHMYSDGIDVTVGEVVSAGQQIGEVGSTGHSTGPHLHFEVHPGGPDADPVDPMPWLTANGADTEDAPTSQGCTA